MIVPGTAFLWLVIMVLGIGIVVSHELRPGDPGTAVETWPSESTIEPDRSRPTIVMAAHPRCPCTRASMEELSRIMARCGDRVGVYVLFLTPEGATEEWTDGDLVRSARALPGAQIVRDENGRQAQLFGAVTSGQTMLYDVGGGLVFRGGITGSRGHAGDNAGQAAIVSYLNRGTIPRSQTPTFGCSLVAAVAE